MAARGSLGLGQCHWVTFPVPSKSAGPAWVPLFAIPGQD
jgi:hypothetical protein